jgi:hypothetical protein
VKKATRAEILRDACVCVSLSLSLFISNNTCEGSLELRERIITSALVCTESLSATEAERVSERASQPARERDIFSRTAQELIVKPLKNNLIGKKWSKSASALHL